MDQIMMRNGVFPTKHSGVVIEHSVVYVSMETCCYGND